MSLRKHISLVLLTAALPLAACGGGDEGQPVPEGEKYTYVVATASVPTSASQATKDFGIDLDGDGRKDNALGSVLATLKGQGLDVQPSLTDAVNDGSIVLLAEFQTKSFSAASASGLRVFLGDSTMITPAACTDPLMIATCGQHLKGTGSFKISASSPTTALVSGPIVGGTFKGGPGTISLQISLTAGAAPLQLDLLGARAELSTITDASIGKGIVAGAISKADLDDKILPAIKGQLDAQVAACTGTPKTPPLCGCMSGSGAAQILSLFDTTPADCAVSLDEIKNNSIIKTLLAPDVECNATGCVANGTPNALSIGLGVTAVKGTFTAP